MVKKGGSPVIVEHLDDDDGLDIYDDGNELTAEQIQEEPLLIKV